MCYDGRIMTGKYNMVARQPDNDRKTRFQVNIILAKYSKLNKKCGPKCFINITS